MTAKLRSVRIIDNEERERVRERERERDNVR